MTVWHTSQPSVRVRRRPSGVRPCPSMAGRVTSSRRQPRVTCPLAEVALKPSRVTRRDGLTARRGRVTIQITLLTNSLPPNRCGPERGTGAARPGRGLGSAAVGLQFKLRNAVRSSARRPVGSEFALARETLDATQLSARVDVSPPGGPRIARLVTTIGHASPWRRDRRTERVSLGISSWLR